MNGRPLRKRIVLRLARAFHPILSISYQGRRLTIDTRDRWIGGELFYSGTWQLFLTDLIGRLELEATVAIDVGANVGVFTVHLSDAVGPRGRVVAIEPSPRAFAILTANAARLQPNVTLVRAAASHAIGEAVLHAPPHHLGDGRMDVHEPCARCTRVETTTIDALTADLGDGAVGLMKIDVQGAETAVLAGARDTLRRNEDLILMIEVESEATRALVAGLWRDGWRGWEIASGLLGPLEEGRPRAATCDLVLARSERALSRLDAAVNAPSPPARV